MLTKKAQIWVSAVLYIAVGVIVLSLILSAGIPLINKMKDRNTILETKKLLFTLDETLRTVANEGPGSQRELTPFNINTGKLYIDEASDEISWELETKAFVIEPGATVHEGVIALSAKEAKKEGFYLVKLQTEYKDILDLKLKTQFSNPLSGKFSLIIKHTGLFNGKKPVLELTVT